MVATHPLQVHLDVTSAPKNAMLAQLSERGQNSKVLTLGKLTPSENTWPVTAPLWYTWGLALGAKVSILGSQHGNSSGATVDTSRRSKIALVDWATTMVVKVGWLCKPHHSSHWPSRTGWPPSTSWPGAVLATPTAVFRRKRGQRTLLQERIYLSVA